MLTFGTHISLCLLLLFSSRGELNRSWYILLSGSVFIESTMYLPRARYDKPEYGLSFNDHRPSADASVKTTSGKEEGGIFLLLRLRCLFCNLARSLQLAHTPSTITLSLSLPTLHLQFTLNRSSDISLPMTQSFAFSFSLSSLVLANEHQALPID